MNIQNVTSQTLKTWLEQEQAILIDVREPAEHASANISGSLLHPLGKINSSDIPSTDKKVVIYCQKGMRGKSACEKVLKNSQADIYNLEGGLADWIQQGFAIEASAKQILPLDRQVQLTIGLTVLISSILAYTSNPAFIWIAAFFGAGLTMAGATGFCGLARVMVWMPWNR